MADSSNIQNAADTGTGADADAATHCRQRPLEQQEPLPRRQHAATPSALPPWIKNVNKSTRTLVTKWIRSVFREACLQVWKARLLQKRKHAASPSRNGKDTDNKIHIVVTHQDLQACTLACRRLGVLWSRKLRQRNIIDVALWVERIVHIGQFWDIDTVMTTDLEQQTRDKINSDSQHQGTLVEVQQAVEEKDRVDTYDRNMGDATKLNSNTNTNITDAQTRTTSTMILQQLQRLGREEDNSLEGKPRITPEEYIRVLDRMGQNGDTFWPYNWDLVEKTARNNKRRIHSETLRGRPRPSCRVKKEYEVIPKSLARQGQGAGADTSMNSNSNDDLAIDNAKRKKLIMTEEQKMMPWAVQRTVRKRKRQTEKNETALIMSTRASATNISTPCESVSLLPPSREPSRHEQTQRWSWQEDVIGSLSQTEQQYLDRTMIRDENEAEPSNIILGALKGLGHVHLCLEQQRQSGLHNKGGASYADTTTSEFKDGGGNDKEKKKKFRKAEKERLGQNKPEQDLYGPRKRWSKVTRATNDEKERWVELDIGECLVELTPQQGQGERVTCAFSSLEVSLMDNR